MSKTDWRNLGIMVAGLALAALLGVALSEWLPHRTIHATIELKPL